MSSSDLNSLHDVYEGLDNEEDCHKTEYMLQFLWRDISSEFDTIGPYFTLTGSIESRFLHSIVVKTMLVFQQYGFRVRGLLCDGASSNLSLLKQFRKKQNTDSGLISPWFVSPYDEQKVYLIICPSHQVCHACIIIIVILNNFDHSIL